MGTELELRLAELQTIADLADGSPLPARVGQLATDHAHPAVRAAALTVMAENEGLAARGSHQHEALAVLAQADREFALCDMHPALVPFRYAWLRARMIALDRLDDRPEETDLAVREAYSFAREHDYEPGIRAGKTNLGLRAADIGRPVEALLHFVDVFSIMPPDERFHGFAHRGIARLLAGAGLHAESLAQLELSTEFLRRAGAAPHEQIPGLADMGMSAIETGAIDTAAELIEKMDSLVAQVAQRDHTSRAAPRLVEVRLLTAAQRCRDALMLYNDQRHLIEAGAPIWHWHPGQVEAEALLAAGEPDAALERALTLHELFPVQLPNQHLLLADIYAELERWSDAIENLRESERRKAVYVFDPGIFLGIGRTRLAEMEDQVAELVRATEQNGERLRQRDTMFSHITHEVRGPLTVLVGRVELWEFQEPPEDAGEMLRTLVAQIRGSLDAIVAQVDIASGHYVERRAAVALDLLITEVVGLFAPMAAAKDSTIVWDQVAPLDVAGQGDQVRLALSNLMSNALKYSPPGSRIEVRCHTEPAEDPAGQIIDPTGSAPRDRVAVITVVDQGPGFSQADLKLAFQPNTRLSAKPTASEASTGVGLSLVKAAIESCGGSVRIEPAAGGGAAVSLTVPVLQLAMVGR